MKRLALASFIAITVGHGTLTLAQDSLVGTYTGNYTVPGRYGNPVQVGVTLTIASVENGVVTGTASQSTGGPCTGDYPMEGKYDGNKLVMKETAKGGKAGDCTFRFNVAQDGNNWVGTTGGGRAIQLSK